MKLSLKAAPFAAVLKAMVLHASRDETRPHMNSVLVRVLDSGDVDLVTTDGHRLAIFRFPASEITWETDREAGECLIPRDDADAWTKVKLAKGPIDPMVTLDTTARTLTSYPTSREFGKVAGHFPPYCQVLPTEAGLHFEAVNPSYLADACKAFQIVVDGLKGGKGNPVSLLVRSGGEYLAPCTLTAPEIPQLGIVVMPMRVGDTDRHKPVHSVKPLGDTFKVPATKKKAA